MGVGIRDDYWFWKGHNYVPQCGKPLWIEDDGAHHIFFDDNIHNHERDSIVAVRTCSSGVFRSVSGRATCNLHGICLVKAQPVQAVLNEEYFLEKISECEVNFSQVLQ